MSVDQALYVWRGFITPEIEDETGDGIHTYDTVGEGVAQADIAEVKGVE